MERSNAEKEDPNSIGSESVLIKWEDHQSNFFSQITSLVISQSLTDVTVTCEDRMFEVHQLVLAVSSLYFRNIFQQKRERGLIVHLKGASAEAFENILQYLYKGQVQVEEGKVVELLSLAEDLKIEGIYQNSSEGGRKNDSEGLTTIEESVDTEPSWDDSQGSNETEIGDVLYMLIDQESELEDDAISVIEDLKKGSIKKEFSKIESCERVVDTVNQTLNTKLNNSFEEDDLVHTGKVTGKNNTEDESFVLGQSDPLQTDTHSQQKIEEKKDKVNPNFALNKGVIQQNYALQKSIPTNSNSLEYSKEHRLLQDLEQDFVLNIQKYMDPNLKRLRNDRNDLLTHIEEDSVLSEIEINVLVDSICNFFKFKCDLEKPQDTIWKKVSNLLQKKMPTTFRSDMWKGKPLHDVIKNFFYYGDYEKTPKTIKYGFHYVALIKKMEEDFESFITVACIPAKKEELLDVIHQEKLPTVTESLTFIRSICFQIKNEMGATQRPYPELCDKLAEILRKKMPHIYHSTPNSAYTLVKTSNDSGKNRGQGLKKIGEQIIQLFYNGFLRSNIEYIKSKGLKTKM